MPSYEYLNDFVIQSDGLDGALVVRHSVCGQTLLPVLADPLDSPDEFKIPVSVALLRISEHTCPGRK
jgi:hypothetical protein